MYLKTGKMSEDFKHRIMESGWGGTANIINGKIYQTVTLPAGNYIFLVNCYT
ncbi:protein of unknown function [Chitinophaga ginsengisegetis]|uniref:DUF5013 domain-containing protein n=1 Tax=Chitinophaga ginsengisegetis TaxID=393003 RepID=A0A1T5NY57_9BACT|nr:protein of unknown function [Chitinophaga ginsengisegetis]